MQTLLFIEDDRDIRAALRLALEDEGYKVLESPDGQSGLKTFASENVDLRVTRSEIARYVGL